MPIPAFLKRALDRGLARRGFERVPSRLVYPWQRAPVDLPSHSGAPLPAGVAENLRADHPRLQELTRAYRELASPLAQDPVWTEALLATADLRQFRGDNPYVWQLRGRNFHELGYALSYYCARRVPEVERLGLLDRLTEDGLFGVHTFQIDGRQVSRDLLDSALELAFLERHLGLSDPASAQAWTVLDIGAGYGRLAHRAVAAFPDTVRYLCTDAIATSTFLCESYLGFRGLAGLERSPARVVALHELEASVQPGTVDLAINIHSFSECAPSAIDAWLAFLAGRRVRHLMIVPNALAGDGVTMLTNAGQEFSSIVRRHGYSLVANQPKYPDPLVQEYGVSPAAHLLFRFEG